MKITLIQPAMGRQSGEGVESWKFEALSLASLAGLTPPGHDQVLIDDRLEPIEYDEPTDLVAITVETYNARRAYQISAEYRRRGVPVVLGGYHPTLVPEEAAEWAEAIVIGEAEPVWARLIDDASQGKLAAVYRAEERPALTGLQPDRTLLRRKKYIPLPLIEASRGCRFACEFCSISAFFRQAHRLRPPREVAAEIEATGRRVVHLVDDNVVADFDAAKRLCREITPLRARWIGQGTLTIADDPELLRELQRSGCAALLFGFESLSATNLKAMNKPFDRISGGQTDAIERIRDHGIRIYASFVLGYDHDTPELIERTFEFAVEQKFFIAAFNHLQPFPGTPVYDRLAREGRLLYDKWWLEPDVHFGDIVYRPKQMPPEELRERVMDIRRRFFGLRGILRRAADFKANLSSPLSGYYFFAANLAMLRDFDRKWRTPLGDRAVPEPSR